MDRLAALDLVALAVTLAVLAANALGATMAVPQMLKLRRSRRVDGVSTVWAGCSAAVNAWWIAYGVAAGDVGIVPVSVVSVVVYVLIAVALVRYGRRPRRAVLREIVGSAVVLGTVPIVPLLLSGWTTAGIVLGALYGVQLAPAVIAVYRSDDVAGVSLTTWAMALVEALLWGVYGAARGDVGLLALAATGTTMSALVLARVLLRRPRRDADSVATWSGTLSPA